MGKRTLYEIESIIHRHTIRRSAHNVIIFYKVRWKGFTEAEDTWETRSNLNVHASALVDAYDRENPFLDQIETSLPSDSSKKQGVFYLTHFVGFQAPIWCSYDQLVRMDLGNVQIIQDFQERYAAKLLANRFQFILNV